MTDQQTENRNAYFMEQLCTIAVCALLGGVAIMMWVQNLRGEPAQPLAVEPARADQPIVLSLKDLADQVQSKEVRELLSGRTVKIKGQFYTSSQEKWFFLVRLQMVCCAADVVPFKVRVHAPETPTGFQNFDDIAAEGKIGFKVLGNEIVPILEVASLDKVRKADQRADGTSGKPMLSIILNPKFHWPLLLGGSVLLVMVLIRAVSVWQAAGQDPTNNHQHDHTQEHDETRTGDNCCAHEHGHEHAHDHGSGPCTDHGHAHVWNPWRFAVLLLPVVLFFLNLPNQDFSKEFQKALIGDLDTKLDKLGQEKPQGK